MYVISKSGRRIELPTPEETAAIQAGIDADPDTYELSDAEFALLRPFSALKMETTQAVDEVPVDIDIVRAFQALGQDWQVRLNDALRDWLKIHSATKPA